MRRVLPLCFSLGVALACSCGSPHATQSGGAGASGGAAPDGGGPDASADGASGSGGGPSDGGPGDASTGTDGGAGAPVLPPLPPGTGTGTTYYVSPSGDDSNAGTSQAAPWKSLAKVTGSTFGPGDSVLFEGGATFSGCPTFSGDKIKSTSTAPFTVGAYGTGPFTLAADCTGAHATAVSISGMNGFFLHQCVITGNQGGAEYGVLIGNPNAAATNGVRIQDCDISGFYATSATDYGAEIFVDGYPGGLDHVYLLNNTLHGTSGPTSPDDNGISGFGNGQDITNALYQGNVVYNIGSKATTTLGGSLGNCILANGIDGGVVQYNVAHACGGNTATCGGPAGIWAAGSSNVVIQYNEAYGVGPAGAPPAGACDWNGYDLDLGVTNSTLQYNWSHDNTGVGYLAYINGTWSGNTIRYNISQNDGKGIALYGNAAQTTDVAVYGNTLYSDAAAASLFQIAVSGGGSIAGHVLDNIFYMAGKGQLVDVLSWNTATVTGLSFLGNDYYAPSSFAITWGGKSYTTLSAWASAAAEETTGGKLVGLSVDPQLAGPGTAGTVGGYAPASLQGYRLEPGSPLVGTGIDPQSAFGIDAGPHDYFGAAIPGTKGTGYNVGADGSE